MITFVFEGASKNALGANELRRLREALRSAAGAPMLITGAGDSFSAGLNLDEMLSLDAPALRDFLVLVEATVSELFQYRGPTVAYVNGHAIGAGCFMVLACDYRVASTRGSARIGLNELALGVELPPRVLEIVRRRLAPRHEVLLLGAALFDVHEALRLGVIDELTDEPEVSRTRLEGLGNHPAVAYARMKRALRGTVASDLVPDQEAARQLETSLQAWTSPETRTLVGRVLDNQRRRSVS